MAITPLPPAPQPTDSTAQFNSKAFAWVASLEDFVTEANATAVQVTALEESAELSATASANSATASANSATSSATFASASATSAETAAAATNAVLWVSGTTYAIGFLVYSPLDKRAYRRLTAGAGTTDPSLDATNWSQLTRVVEQSDIGTAPNEIPLNQYLGSLAYQSSESAIIESGRIDLKGGGSNLFLYSQEFNNGGWLVASLVTVTANSTVAPDGTTTADTIAAKTNGIVNAIFRNLSTAAPVGSTVSVYAKADTVDFLAVAIGATSNVWASFDLSTGTLGSNGVGCTPSIVDAGGGWYRCILSDIGTASVQILMFPKAADVAGDPYSTGSVSIGDSIFLWGAQLEKSSTLGNYIATEATAIPLENAPGATALSVIPTTGFDTTYPMAFELASDTSLVVKVKGSDGTVRSATLTLA